MPIESLPTFTTPARQRWETMLSFSLWEKVAEGRMRVRIRRVLGRG